MNRSETEDLKKSIYEIVRMIPYGRVTSYGAIARAIGFPNQSRMIGRIMSQCPSDLNIPAHRVVNSQGILSAKDVFGSAPDEMQKRLESEAIIVGANDKIKNWKLLFWDPLKEI